MRYDVQPVADDELPAGHTWMMLAHARAGGEKVIVVGRDALQEEPCRVLAEVAEAVHVTARQHLWGEVSF